MSNDTSKCRFHPDSDAVARCNKHEWGYCEKCLESCQACTDPDLYCRHRSSCFIWELCRKQVRNRRNCASDA